MNLPLKAAIACVLALSFAVGVAFAQPPAGGGGGGGHGAALRAACGADIEKFCPNLQPGPDMRACVRKNYASLSDGCRSAIDQMRSQHQQQQSQGGGAASAPQ